MGLFTELFAWWTGNTIGTRLFTWRKGERVGEDGLGNIYYRERNGQARWVIYRTLAEPSQVPPGMACLAASHRRCAADAESYRPRPVGAGASPQSDRDL